MNATLGPSPSSTTPVTSSSPAGTLQLRLANGAHQGRLVELRARRCSIGSAPQCTLRLRAAGIEPVHCLIDRTGDVTIVRRHAGESLVNGQAFEQSPLSVGDRLQLGPLEFEVLLDTRHALAAAAADCAGKTSLVHASSQPDVPHANSSGRNGGVVEDAFRQLDTRFADLEQRLAELGRTLESPPAAAPADETEHHWPQQREQLAAQVAGAVRSQLADELNAKVSAEVVAQVDAELGGRVAAEVGAQLGPQVAETAAHLTQQITVQLESDLSSRLYSQLATQFSAEATARIAELVDQRLVEQVQSIEQRVAEHVEQRVTEHVEQRLNEHLARHVGEQTAQSQATLGAQLSADLAEQLSRRLPDEVRQQVDSGLAAASQQLGAQLSLQIDETVASTVAAARAEIAGPLAEDVAGRVLPDLLARLDERSHVLAGQVADTVQPRLAAEVSGQLAQQLDQAIEQRTARLEAELSERLTSEIAQQVSEDLAPRLTSDVSRRVAADVAPRVAAEVTAEVADRLSARLVEETASRVASQVMPQVLTEVASHTGPELVQRVTGQVSQQVMSLASSQLESGMAAWEAARANWNQRQQLFEAELVDQCAAIDERLQSIVELQQHIEAQRAEQAQPGSAPPQPQLAERIDEIQRALAELCEQQAQSSEQRQRWQQTLDELRGELDQRGEKTRLQLNKLESRWEAFEREQRHRQADHENSTSEQISQRLASIRAEREAFENERHHERAGAHPGEHVRLADERRAEIHGGRTVRDRQSQWPEDAEDRSSLMTNSEVWNVRTESQTLAIPNAPQVNDDPIQAETLASGLAILAESTTESAPSAQLLSVHKADHSRSADSFVDEATPQDPANADAQDANVEQTGEASAGPDVADEGSQAGDTTTDSHSPLSMHASSPEPARSSDEDDESIEAYMARLMQRVRSISPDSEPAAHSSTPKSQPAAVASPQPVTSMVALSEPAMKCPGEEPGRSATAPILDLSELAPRSLPAESTSNISAMRDLANMTARSAIHTHHRKCMSGVIYSKLAVAIAALLAAVALAWMSTDSNHVTYAAALVSMVIGVAWGLQYLLLTGGQASQLTIDDECSTDDGNAAE